MIVRPPYGGPVPEPVACHARIVRRCCAIRFGQAQCASGGSTRSVRHSRVGTPNNARRSAGRCRLTAQRLQMMAEDSPYAADFFLPLPFYVLFSVG